MIGGITCTSDGGHFPFPDVDPGIEIIGFALMSQNFQSKRIEQWVSI